MHVPLLAAPPGRDVVASWRAAGSPKQVLLEWRGPDTLAALQALGRRCAVWLEATPADDEEALDLAVAGAAHIVARWPRDAAWIAATGADLADLLVVASSADDRAAAAAAAPDSALALLTADGLEADEQVTTEPESVAGDA